MRRHGLQLPDFVVGGAPRAGTTWLYHLLDRHPDAWMARPVVPEPKFFLVDDTYARGLDHYATTWFESAPPDALVGEKSSNYLESATAAERLHRDLPDVRLVFSLREPARRALSNHRWSRMNGMEELSFGEALRREEEREATLPDHLRFARPYAYYGRGLYARMLTPWFERFGRDQIHVLLFEDIVDRPRDVARQLHSFLGLAPRPHDATTLGPVNASEPHEQDVTDELQALRAQYRPANRELAELLGRPLTAWESDG